MACDGKNKFVSQICDNTVMYFILFFFKNRLYLNVPVHSLDKAIVKVK